jgi:excisionase family DNA binding protein
MTDRIIIPLPGIGTLELTREAYEAALRPLHAAASVAADATAAKLVNAQAIAELLSLPVSCVYEYAKAGRIPCVRAGKHVRFDAAAVRAALGAVTVGRSNVS